MNFVSTIDLAMFSTQDLSNYTTTGIGPVVDYFFLPKNKEEVIQAVQYIKDNNLEFYILGGGSNTIIDNTMDSKKAVICLLEYKGIKPLEDYNILVRSGTVLQDVVDYAFNNELSGITGLNRIPGTIGGSVVGNAGAYGTEVRQTIVSVTCLDLSDLSIQTFSIDGCEYGYRDSVFKRNLNLLVLDITLSLTKPVDYALEAAKYEEISEFRDKIYPKGFKSPGSVFKNFPQGTVSEEIMANIPQEWVVYNKLPVGKLLEEVGSKGYNINGVRMRLSHGNIMEVFAPATYQDVDQLLTELKARVKDRFGLTIEPEIRLVSQFRKF